MTQLPETRALSRAFVRLIMTSSFPSFAVGAAWQRAGALTLAAAGLLSGGAAQAADAQPQAGGSLILAQSSFPPLSLIHI